MNRRRFQVIASLGFALILTLDAAWQAQAQDAKSPYPSMATLEQYLIADRNDEVTLARSSTPEAVSRDATVLVPGRQG